MSKGTVLVVVVVRSKLTLVLDVSLLIASDGAELGVVRSASGFIVLLDTPLLIMSIGTAVVAACGL